MFASVSRAKQNLGKPLVSARSADPSRTSLRPNQQQRQQTDLRKSSTAPTNGVGSAARATRSTFAERNTLTRQPAEPRPKSFDMNSSTTKGIRRTKSSQATNLSHLTATARAKPAPSAAPPRIWNRNSRDVRRARHEGTKASDSIEALPHSDIALQTDEAEILDHDLLIGDVKFLLPSPHLVVEIEHIRQEIKRKELLKAQRKFEEQEQHLTDLKEFLERAAITKRHRKDRDHLEEDRSLISSMDHLLSREMPKTPSMADFKERIKKKETELLRLFDSAKNKHFWPNVN